MPDGDALFTLMTWLSPAFPVGAYTYSHGLEHAIAAGQVTDGPGCRDWIADVVQHGAGRTDAIVSAHAWRAEAADDGAALDDLAELALALAPSAERLLETEAQGAAFAAVTAQVWGQGAPAPYPVALGRAASRQGIALDAVLTGWLQAFVSNLVSAAIRLVPLGQTEGQAIIADLRPVCRTVAAQAGHAPLSAIGGCAFAADIASMRHETQDVRLFRS